MERITLAHVNRELGIVNAGIAPNGYKLTTQGRNNILHIDLEPLINPNYSALEVLASGSTRHIYNYLRGMAKALELTTKQHEPQKETPIEELHAIIENHINGNRSDFKEAVNNLSKYDLFRLHSAFSYFGISSGTANATISNALQG